MSEFTFEGPEYDREEITTPQGTTWEKLTPQDSPRREGGVLILQRVDDRDTEGLMHFLQVDNLFDPPARWSGFEFGEDDPVREVIAGTTDVMKVIAAADDFFPVREEIRARIASRG
ncbi:hypothetical protein HN748_03465 [Candidatus Peregrinibacteria bacterium]|jgi:hypothetical protein|nr:hypothetical protein [Candidatus Peregrinibacteria bacterium]MBT7483360.1 hypothetical protein [Candidatus Peregrinibacteria bacterium]MBT7703267.1 hypothetical protein [Candidatus Peregrinibacteria bacterium]